MPAALTGPAFGTYSPDEVSWLLKDLSRHELEDTIANREIDIRAGRRHYSETLPIEYAASPRYVAAFERALEQNALAVAVAVGVLGECILRRRGPSVVLVSLARAGVPVGVLLRRWLRRATGVEAPHYALSVIRDRGIDGVALAHVVARHDPSAVQFVDGWTGKGVIARELVRAVGSSAGGAGGGAPDAELGVLSDPLGFAALRGTRRDFLIPSACLNSTVSGLVSRTVLNAELIGPDDFHGAKFYGELRDGDRSHDFVDTVSALFDEADRVIAAGGADPAEEPSRLTGTAAVAWLLERCAVEDPNRLKPGVGEATRVLLRRVPQRLVLRSDRAGELDHLLVLAEERSVPVEVDDALPVSCVAIVAGGAEEGT
jgi:hypothetical protein